MAKKCNLCKSTLNLIEDAQFTGENKSSITLCTKCNETVMVMQSYSTDEKLIIKRITISKITYRNINIQMKH